MDILILLIYLVLGGAILFFIIACAVKSAVKEAVRELREEIRALKEEINKTH